MRLGLVLAEIGRRENVVVTEQELADAMRAEAMRYGDMAQRMFDMLRESPQAQANMRAPLYEEKVVDLILARATVTDKVVSKEELLKEDELPEGFSEEAPAKKAAARKPAAKKAEAAKPAKSKPAAAAAGAEVRSQGRASEGQIAGQTQSGQGKVQGGIGRSACIPSRATRYRGPTP